MIESLEKIDQKIFLFLNGLHTEWLDSFMFLVSHKLTWIPLYLFILFYAFRKKGWQFSVLLVIATLTTVALADQISLHAFKNVFERYRPSHNGEFGHLVHVVRDFKGEEYRGGSFGFVSSHAANMFGIATIIGLLFRSTQKSILWLLLIWAALIAYSRIYLGVHYPADILVGGILGALLGFLVYLLARFIGQKLKIIE